MASNSSLSKTTQSLLEHQTVSFLDNFKMYSSTTRFKTWLIVNNQGQWKGRFIQKGHEEIHDDFWVTLFFFSFKQMSLGILSWSNITLNTSHLLFFKSKQCNHFIFRRLSAPFSFLLLNSDPMRPAWTEIQLLSFSPILIQKHINQAFHFSCVSLSGGVNSGRLYGHEKVHPICTQLICSCNTQQSIIVSQDAIWHESLLEPTSKTFSAFLFLFNWYILASQMAQKN